MFFNNCCGSCCNCRCNEYDKDGRGEYERNNYDEYENNYNEKDNCKKVEEYKDENKCGCNDDREDKKERNGKKLYCYEVDECDDRDDKDDKKDKDDCKKEDDCKKRKPDCDKKEEVVVRVIVETCSKDKKKDY